jgi:hypothetical protein
MQVGISHFYVINLSMQSKIKLLVNEAKKA